MTQAKVLVVEDEMIVALDLQSKLERMGYSVPITCNRGEDAVEQVGELRPDIVLMDINLAGEIDGVEAALRIRDRFFVPVVFLTAFSDEATLQRAKQAHPSGYLLKPFQDKELHATLSTAISRHRADRQQRILQQVHEAIWDMQRERDIGDVLVHIKSALQELGIPFNEGSINLVDASADPPTVRFCEMNRDAEWAELESQNRELVVRMWRGGVPVYRRDLAQEDFHGEQEALSQHFGEPVRAVLDVPFAQGTLSINSTEPDPFSDDDIAVLGELVHVLEDGFRRLQDIRALEQRNQALEREIAERKRAEAESARLENQLLHAQKMEAVGELSAGIAHNFNNMLGAVVGNLELVMMEDLGEAREYLEEAVASCQEAADIVKQLLVFSRRSEIAREPVPIYPLVEQVMGICRRTFDRKIEIDVQGDTSEWAVMGDRGQLYQAFLNLCINARDAVEDLVRNDGKRLPRIALEVGRVHLNAAERDAHPEARPGPYVRLTIADNGSGMDAEIRERIFEPFFTTKEMGRGTGLGLAIVYSVMEQHGGWIDVQSSPGDGTTFQILLPARAAVQSEPPATRETGLIRGTETLLIVDDEPSVRSMQSSLLTRCGYTILTAQDGEEGVAVLDREKEEIDLVLLDLSMPRMSGLQALSRMRTIKPGIKVIVQTGYIDEVIGLEETVEVIAKPFQVRNLLATLRRVLDDQTGDSPPDTGDSSSAAS